MSSSEEVAVEVSAPAGELPGRFLRAAREERGLTIADVAQSLKFSVRQIEALEADDFAALQGATFVRGFVRSYAKLLKIDSAPLVALLDVEAPVTPPDVRPPENIGTTMPRPGQRRTSPLVAAAALMVVLAEGLLVWHSISPIELPYELRRPPSREDAAVAVRPPDVRVQQPGAVTNVAVAAPVPEMLAPDARQLVFIFLGKSWVEVKDATQRVLFSGENPADSRQTVAGRPPFQIVIGNATQVQLYYEDREIDLTPHTRAEVARLMLE